MRALKGLAVVLLLFAGACAEPEATAPDTSELGPAFAKGVTLTPVEQLGRSIYFDQNLSLNRNQACATCHHPMAGFAAPNGNDRFNETGGVIEGSVPGGFGNRKPPTASYAAVSPPLYYDDVEGLFIGGNFWDGRATGWTLGNPSAEQALGPFLNPVEQALSDNACVVYRVCNGDKKDYGVSMEEVWGPEVCTIAWPNKTDKMCEQADVTIALSAEDRAKVDAAYDQIGLSIAAFEASPEVNQYSSKFDAWLAGAAVLTAEEEQGRLLFEGKAQCALCHITDDQENGDPPLFTDFTFDNLGIPINTMNPNAFPDPGLGGFLSGGGVSAEWAALAGDNMGKHKVSTLRNLNKRTSPHYVRAYGHNAYFKSIAGIVHFYNTRDCAGNTCPNLAVQKTVCPVGATEAYALEFNCWPPPEVADNVNDAELGNLGLTAAEEAQLVAFLKTLDDGYMK
jgi:cytochrome c peroxidase